ncbi:MAG: helix-turn-helix domain-containing protein [Alphaproteobacteria bacterium]|nr:helix-turn-helix domain-containing protein [Alphaproteobacteria bacterium]
MAGKEYVKSAIDEHIASRIQLRRMMLGLSQKDLGEKCGVSCQQIQKYESATNRISAVRLFQVSRALETPVSFFFMGLPGNLPEETKATKSHRVCSPDENDPMGKTETLRLINMYWKLPNNKQRTIIMDILSALSQGDKVSVTEEQSIPDINPENKLV